MGSGPYRIPLFLIMVNSSGIIIVTTNVGVPLLQAYVNNNPAIQHNSQIQHNS